jgi:DNA topoisomerase VI subunit A
MIDLLDQIMVIIIEKQAVFRKLCYNNYQLILSR